MIEFQLADPRVILVWHEDDHAIGHAASPAGLVVDGFDSRSWDLEVVIGSKQTWHIFMTP